MKQFPGALLYSKLQQQTSVDHGFVLIIDNIGMLSRLYKYSYCCYVGGGLSNTGVHNVLEAAVYNKPVIFGKNFYKYREVNDLIEAKGAYAISNKDDFIVILNQFIANTSFYLETGNNAGGYVKTNAGATEKILHYIQEKRLLTN
ncbi:MAG TPA: hypothetical protein VET23_12165 [Chitinophagaceae bacterium]|nr:hypothetical protein [Chitinophagaceae bacterium]